VREPPTPKWVMTACDQSDEWPIGFYLYDSEEACKRDREEGRRRGPTCYESEYQGEFESDFLAYRLLLKSGDV